MAKTEVSRTTIFEDMPVYKAILTLAIPNVINQMANVVYNLADTFFIGRLNDRSMVAALTITAPVMLLITALSNLFCVGSCTLIAAALGSKNKKKAEDLATLAPILALAAGLIVTLVMLIFPEAIARYSGATDTSLVYTKQYQFWVMGMNAIPMLMSTTIGAGLRGRGYSKYEMYGITLGNILNVILDPIFIFTFGMGVSGAGAATCLSTVISLLFFFVIASRMQKKEHLYTPLNEFKLDLAYAGQIVATGFPAFLHNVLTSVTNTLQMNLVKNYSDAAVASIGIARKIEHVFGQIVIGISQGVIPLLSYNYAANKYGRFKEIIKKTIIICAMCGALSVLVIFPIPETFIRLFINDQETIDVGIAVVRIFCFMPLTIVPQICIRTSLQSMGEKKLASLYSIFRQILFYAPMLLILNHFFGLNGAAFTNVGADILVGAVGVPLLANALKKARNKALDAGSAE